MPGRHKIALFGTGYIGRLVYAGLAALTYCETKKEESVFDMLKITEPVDYTTLVKSYKKVQRKYYPEQDIYKKESDECRVLKK